MARNYTLTTIKALFAEASGCAYPACEEALVFHDRGKATVVAEIAHIRSEQPNGPRFDASYADDINGPANLLLLCGKHHRPIDRHEAEYTISELEAWKRAQRASAGVGTPITERDARAYARLSPEEHKILMDVARLASRVTRACRAAQDGMDAVRAENEQARIRSSYQLGPMYEVHDDGSKALVNDRIQLPWVEQRKWETKVEAAREEETPRVRQALDDLADEVSVLRMISGSLGVDAGVVSHLAERVSRAVGDREALDIAVAVLDASVARLWQVATGGTDGAARDLVTS
ncbi:hypothetical protein BJF78_26135 [Pseudonocardia sp. CNS-139]|nr:hypothetical protein BJF78_26135 [Pseudonocardia sp. CNS-139]